MTSASYQPGHLWLPPPALSACVRAAVMRSTLGHALDETQRFNHFPASPVCTISWFFSGVAELAGAEPSAEGSALLPRIVVSGPQSRPLVSWNPGAVDGLMLMIYPDAFHAMTGMDPTGFIDRFAPAAEVLPAEWYRWCEAVLDCRGEQQRLERVEEFLAEQWYAFDRAHGTVVRRFEDWAQNLATRAAISGRGRSLRQIERRIKAWTGQPLRGLRTLGRAERAFFAAVMASDIARPDWTEVAGLAGYADQSHLCREVKRVTGFSPQDLHRRMHQDESLWVYRVWGQHMGTCDRLS